VKVIGRDCKNSWKSRK